MKNFKLLIFVLIFTSSKLFANEIDSIKNVLFTTREDTSKLMCLNVLGMFYYQNFPDSAKQYWQNELNIANKCLQRKSPLTLRKKYLSAKGNALSGIAYLLSSGTETERKSAVKLDEEALVCFEEAEDIIGQGIALNNISSYYITIGNNLLARKYLFKSVVMGLKSSKQNIVGYAYQNIALTYRNEGLFWKAVEFLNKSLEVRIRSLDTAGMSQSYYELGIVSVKQNDIENAINLFSRCFDIAKNKNFKTTMAKSLNELGMCYFMSGRKNEALKDFFIAEKQLMELNNYDFLPFVYTNLAKYYSAQENIDSSIFYIKKSIEIRKLSGDVNGIMISEYLLGKELNKKGDLKAIDILLSANESAKKLNHFETIEKSAFELSKLYYKKNNTLKAYEFLNEYLAHHDSIYNTDIRKKTLSQQYKHDNEKEILELKHKQEKERVEINAQKEKQIYILIFVLLFSVVLATFLWFVVKRLKLTQKQNFEISEQRNLIQTQKSVVEEKQKEILDSIHYAARIQRSLITNEKYIKSKLNRTK